MHTHEDFKQVSKITKDKQTTGKQHTIANDGNKGNDRTATENDSKQ